jgi:transposase-like protein
MGRQVLNQWVFGDIDRGIREYFAVLVDRRNGATLLPIIYQNIGSGTTTYSDQWTAYNNITNDPQRRRSQHLNTHAKRRKHVDVYEKKKS